MQGSGTQEQHYTRHLAGIVFMEFRGPSLEPGSLGGLASRRERPLGISRVHTGDSDWGRCLLGIVSFVALDERGAVDAVKTAVPGPLKVRCR